MARRAVHAHELRQDLNDAAGPNAAGHIDRQGFPRPFVDDGQTLQLLPVRARVKHEVVRPHVIRPGWWQGTWTAGGHAAPRTPPRHLERGLAPEPMRPVRAHRMAGPLQEDPNPPIAIEIG